MGDQSTVKPAAASPNLAGAAQERSGEIDDLADRLIDTEETAQWLNVTSAWVQEMARTGEMPAFKLGGRYWRFSKAQVARWLIERQQHVHERRRG